MGAYSWQTTLLHGGSEVADLPGAASPTTLEPWSSDSNNYAYVGFDVAARESYVVLRRIDGTEKRLPDPSDYITTIQWSQSRDRFLAVGTKDVTVFGADGTSVARVSGSGVEDEWPSTGWLPSGDHFFILARATEEGAAELRFFSADAEPEETFALDPTELVPYEADLYAPLRRDFWSLGMESSSAVGSFLDHWAHHRYDPRTGELSLGILRPTSPPFQVDVEWGKEWVARAEDKWIAVQLHE